LLAKMCLPRNHPESTQNTLILWWQRLHIDKSEHLDNINGGNEAIIRDTG